LRRVRLGRSLDTLPERLALARSRQLGHAEFLELVLSDEVTRSDPASGEVRADKAGLEPTMRLEAWDDTDAVTYDRAVLEGSSRSHEVTARLPVNGSRTSQGEEPECDRGGGVALLSGTKPRGPPPMARQLAFLGTSGWGGNIEQCSAPAPA